MRPALTSLRLAALASCAAGTTTGTVLAGTGLATSSWPLLLAGTCLLLACEALTRHVLTPLAGHHGPWPALASLARGWAAAAAVLATTTALVTLPGPARDLVTTTLADAAALLPAGLRDQVTAALPPPPPPPHATALAAAVLLAAGLTARLARMGAHHLAARTHHYTRPPHPPLGGDTP